MLLGLTVLNIGLILIIIFYELSNFAGIYVAILIHGLGFSTSVGSVAWFYVAELMNAKGVAYFSFVYWFCMFLIGIAAPYMI